MLFEGLELRTSDLLVRSSAKAAFLSDFCAIYHIITRKLQIKLVILPSVQTCFNISLHTKCTHFCTRKNSIDQKVIVQNEQFARFCIALFVWGQGDLSGYDGVYSQVLSGVNGNEGCHLSGSPRLFK